VSERFVSVLFVHGNHCYYRHDFVEWNTNFRTAEIKPNIIFSTDGVEEYHIPGFRFLLTTLWADGGNGPLESLQIQ
jgi:hypothetical protein